MRELEHREAVAFMRGIEGFRGRPGLILIYPQLKWLHHIPNGGLRNRTVAAKLKAEGVKAGVVDYFLPWPHEMAADHRHHHCHHYCGLYVELKAGKNKPTETQLEFMADMKEAGYAVAWATGARACLDIVEAYLKGEWKNEQ